MMQQSQQQYEEEPRLKSYLDALEKPLASLGEAAQSDWRQEAEAHLFSLIAAHEELGLSHEQAVAAALKQFGDTQRIGKNVAHQMSKRQRFSASALVPIMLTTVTQGLGVVGIAMLGTTYQSETTPEIHFLMRFIACSLFVVIPLISGWSWQQLLVSEKRKWVRLASSLIFPQYGFYAGYVYAMMFELRLGEPTLSMPVLMGILCFSFFGMVAASARQYFEQARSRRITTQ